MEFITDNFSTLTRERNQVEKLKDLVLDLAIRGQLVPQRQDALSSDDIYNQIASEKKELLKNKKVRIRKKIPALTEIEIPFKIPENWKWCRLGEICYDHGQKKPDKQFCYIDVGSIDNGKGEISENCKTLPPEEAPSRARKLVEKGTVIYSTVRPYLLNIAIVNQDFPFEPIVSTAFAILHPYKGVNSKFLYWYLRSQSFIKYVEAQMVGVAYPAINDKSFFLGPFPLPPTEEQHRIVQKVTTLFQQIDRLAESSDQAEHTRARLRRVLLHRLEQAPTQLETEEAWLPLHDQFDLAIRTVEDVQALRQTILQLAVKGQLVAQDPDDEPASVLLERIKAEKAQMVKEGKIRKQKKLAPISEEEVPFEVPEGWVWCRLEEIISSFLGGYAYKSTKYVEESGNQIIRLGNVKNDFLKLNAKPVFISDELAEETKDFEISAGDLLITMTGTRAKRDYCFTHLVRVSDLSQKRIFLNQRVGCLKMSSFVFFEYVNIALKANLLLDPIFLTATGTANQANIGSGSIRNMLFPLPPYNEQRWIVAKVKRLLKWCDKLEATFLHKEEKLKNLVDAAMHLNNA